jgi:hypothetical protein
LREILCAKKTRALVQEVLKHLVLDSNFKNHNIID